MKSTGYFLLLVKRNLKKIVEKSADSLSIATG
jgi:hypothetical protein